MPTTTLSGPNAATPAAPPRIVIRPPTAATAADGPALVVGFERLGEASRYQRFLSAMPHLTDAQLRYLMNVDQRANVALAAIDPSDGIVGVGRFVRLSRCEAEPAIAIADGYQGQGIGIALLRALTDCAQRRG